MDMNRKHGKPRGPNVKRLPTCPINIYVETKEFLDCFKSPNETYPEVIARIIKERARFLHKIVKPDD
jgi:hypothetical protein